MILSEKIVSAINNRVEKEFDPFYLYDIEKIRNHCQNFQDIEYQNKSVHFASMANINPKFLKIVKEEKVNVFVNSVLHLKTVREAGFENQEVIFTASALTEKTMRFAHECGVQLNLDSINQLKLWQKMFPGEKVGIRCNIGDKVNPYATHAGVFIGKESRLGFSREEISSIPDKSLIRGLHLYAGTDIFDIDYLISCYNELINISQDFPKLEYLNFGGGFGVAENGIKVFDMTSYNSRVSKLMNEVSAQKGYSIKLILEPGRIMGGDAGYFVCHATDVKKRDSCLVGLNASTVQFSRPLMYPDIASHPVMVIRNGIQLVSEALLSTTIYGCSTYSRDLFSRKIPLPEIQIGDIVVFGNAGSYSASSHSQFLGFEKPEEYFI